MYEAVRIPAWNRHAMEEVRELLKREELGLDPHLDYTAGIYEGDRLTATGSFYRNTLRCLAVDDAHQGEGLMATVVTHLVSELFSRGERELFIYTKKKAAQSFASLGFYEIVRLDEVVFLENRQHGFESYLASLKRPKSRPGARVGAIVMNANPFTLGHRYLVEQAAAQCDGLHLFMVSEDVSDFPRSVRERLIRAGVSDLKNVFPHPTGPYLVSSATFPSYFIREDEALTLAHAKLDAKVFSSIASALHITDRFVGEEPLSPATALYNRAMAELLPQEGIRFHVLKRKSDDGVQPISASRVRALLREGKVEAVRPLVPDTTYAFLTGDEGRGIINRLQAQAEVQQHP